MNKADYIRELDSLHAPEELRQRLREQRPRRRSVLRPLAAVACLTLVLVGGGSVLRLLMGGMGASSGMAEGGTQATADIVFQSYAGPVLPLLQLEGDELTARRTLSMTCGESGNTLTVEDCYDLSGEGDVVFSLPLAASLYELSEMEPELYADGQLLDSTLSPGASPAFGEEPDFGWYEEALSGSDAGAPELLEQKVTLYRISGLPEAEEGDQTHFGLTGTLNPEESLLLTWGLSGGQYEEESGAVRVSGSLAYESEGMAAVLGEPLQNAALEGYTDGSCTERLEDFSGSVSVSTTTVGKLLESWSADLLTRMELEKREELLPLLAEASARLLPEIREQYGGPILEGETLLCDVLYEKRVFYLTASLTLSGENTLTARYRKSLSVSYGGGGADPALRGCDFLSLADRAVAVTRWDVRLTLPETISLLDSNMGFSLQDGVYTASPDPRTERYWMTLQLHAGEP